MLVGFEFRKNLTPFRLILAAILLMLSFALALWQCRDGLTAAYKEQIAAQDELLAMAGTAEYAALREDFLARRRAYEASIYISMSGGEPGFAHMENVRIDQPGYGDEQLFGDVEAILGAPDAYTRLIGTLLQDSAKKLRDISDTDSYAYRYNRGILLRYDKFFDAKLPVHAVRGWNEFFALETPSLLLLITAILLTGGVYCREAQAGMTPILRVSRRGHHPLILAKLSYCLTISALLTLLFTAAALSAAAIAYGLSSPGVPAQLLDDFAACPYQLTVGGLAFLRMAVQMLMTAALTVTAALIGKLAEREAAALTAGAVILGIGIALDAIDPAASLGWLAKFSPTAMAHGSIFFEKYRGLHLFGCSDYTAVLLAFTAEVMLLSGGAALLVHPAARQKEQKREGTGRILRMPLFLWEGYKLFVNRRGALILAAVLIVKLFLAHGYFAAPISGDEQVFADYMARLSGPLTAEKIAYIDGERAYIEAALAEYPAAQTAWRQGELDAEAYARAENRFYYAEYADGGFALLEERLAHLEAVSAAHPDAEFLFDEGASRWFGAPVDAALTAAILLTVSGVFAMEYDDGFAAILRLTRHGRRRIFLAKLGFSLILTLALCAWFTAIDARMLAIRCPIDYAHAPLQSLPGFGDLPVKMTVGGGLILHTLMQWGGALLLCVLTASISAVAKNSVRALTVGGILVLLPMTGIPRILLGAVCIIAAPAALIAAHRSWNHTS